MTNGGAIRVVTRQTLAAARCADPDCKQDHPVLYLHQDCHGSTGVRASYNKETCLLTLKCAACGAPVCAVLVGSMQ
jgi:hypothetical protein